MSEIYPIAVPKWGIEMIEGTLNTWNKREGDSVSKGDEVFDMESDKIVNVWESPVNGVLRRIIAPEGDARPVGALLGVIAAAEVSDAEIDAFIANYATGETQEAAPKSVATSAGTGPDVAVDAHHAGGRGVSGGSVAEEHQEQQQCRWRPWWRRLGRRRGRGEVFHRLNFYLGHAALSHDFAQISPRRLGFLLGT